MTRLDAVAERVGGDVHGDPATSIQRVSADTRHVEAGDLFACIPGARVDGHDLAPRAVAAGAVALLVQRPLGVPVPQLRVKAVREAVGPASHLVAGDPSAALAVLGVTGTNGKTTVTWMLDAIATAAGRRTALVGTVRTHVAGRDVPNPHTTPEAPDLVALLGAMRAADVDVCAMEVSSHALAQHRVDGVRFAACGFTNLTQDHLDFHGDLETYFASKARLFTPEFTARAAICVDDPWGQRLAAAVPAAVTVSTATDQDAAWTWLAPDLVRTPHGARKLVVRAPGGFNRQNALLAAALTDLAGLPWDATALALSQFAGAPGRYELAAAAAGRRVYVDYAHTPDGVRAVLAAARAEAGPDGRVLVVLGCGGDRDRAKRPRMGAVATAGADVAYLTTDNPRSEDPAAILEEMRAGAAANHVAVLDRRAAIRAAVAAAHPGDVVVVAGKGHEDLQEWADRRVPFSDVDEAAAAAQEAWQ